MQTHWPLTIVISLCTLAAGCNQPAAPAYVVTQERVCYYEEKWCEMAVSATGDHVATIETNDRKVLFRDGKVEATYDDIWFSHDRAFSPDGKRLAYWVRKGDKWVAVVDGVEGTEFDQTVDLYSVGTVYPIFSPDSRRVAYAGQRDGKCYVVIDGKLSGPYDRVLSVVYCGNGLNRLPDIFSADSRRYAFSASKDKKWRIIIDGREGKEYDQLEGPVQAPAGTSVAYVACEGKKEFLILDGKQVAETSADLGDNPDDSRWFASIRDLIFSPDGKRLAYRIIGPNYSFDCLGLDGKTQGKWDIVRDLRFSPDSKRFACVVGKDKHCQVWLDGQLGPVFDEIQEDTLTFSPYSRRFAYVGKRDGRSTVVLDGKEGPFYQEVLKKGGKIIPDLSGPMFSPDAMHVAYPVFDDKKGVMAMVLDGKEQPALWFLECAPVFHQDGRLIYSEWNVESGPSFGEGRPISVLTIGDKKVPLPGRAISICISPDGKKVLALAEKSYGTWTWCVDGQVLEPAPASEDPLSIFDRQKMAFPPVFKADGSIEFLAMRNGAIVRILCKPNKK